MLTNNKSGIFHNVLSGKGLMVGLIFFVLVVGSTQFYYWRVRRAEAASVALTAQAVRRLQNKTETRTAQSARIIETFEETTDQINPPIPEEPPVFEDAVDFTDAFLPDDMPLPDAEDPAGVPTSPFGFGPYPELPEGWSADTFPAASANDELMARVRIKLLSQGIHTESATFEKGFVYPVIKGTLYVKWKEIHGTDGVFRYISAMLGHPDDTARFGTEQQLEAKDVPSDIKLVPFEEGAIDPYTFLNLPRRR